MQKYDYVRGLRYIVEQLHCETVVFEMESLRKLNHEKAVTASQLAQLMFTIKSAYDALSKDENYQPFLEAIAINSLYNNSLFLKLTSKFNVNVTRNDLLYDVDFINFYVENVLMIRHLKLAENLLVTSNIFEDDPNEKGYLLLEIQIDENGLESSKYVKIIQAIKELIETVSTMVGEDINDPEIILLDSGSDTNIGVVAGVETAKTITGLFKEAFDYIVNLPFAKQKRKQEALKDMFSTLADIRKAKEAGLISEDDEAKYKYLIQSRVDELIGLGVKPKDSSIEIHIDRQKLLPPVDAPKLLGNGDKETT